MKLQLFVVPFAILSATALATSTSSHECCSETPPSEVKPEPPATPAADLIDLKNEKCPIMGGDADKEVFLDYEGVRIYFCCPGCDRRFLKDPAKYLKVLGIDDLAQFKKERQGSK